MPTLNRDPRWRRSLEQQFRCSTCDELHQGLFDLACVKALLVGLCAIQWYGLAGHGMLEAMRVKPSAEMDAKLQDALGAMIDAFLAR